MEMRLDKLLAHYGVGTRKEVKNYIRKGFVCINDEVIKKDDYKVDIEKDKVVFDGEIVNYKPYVYIMLNKPAGYVCATKDNVHPTVLELIHDYYNYELFPVGRLDLDTEGLLIISNDGDFAHRLLAPSRNHSKLYYAKVAGVIDDNDIQLVKDGLKIDKHLCKPGNLTVLSKSDNSCEIELEIFEGKFHQVKKMILALGKEVTFLKRIKIRNLELDNNLKLGQYRELTERELVDLKDNL